MTKRQVRLRCCGGSAHHLCCSAASVAPRVNQSGGASGFSASVGYWASNTYVRTSPAHFVPKPAGALLSRGPRLLLYSSTNMPLDGGVVRSKVVPLCCVGTSRSMWRMNCASDRSDSGGSTRLYVACADRTHLSPSLYWIRKKSLPALVTVPVILPVYVVGRPQ